MAPHPDVGPQGLLDNRDRSFRARRGNARMGMSAAIVAVVVLVPIAGQLLQVLRERAEEIEQECWWSENGTDDKGLPSEGESP